MATTTNYSWTTPDDTALVKDGALAIRTLGSSVDTTVKNLNPETTTGAISYRGATANQKTALPIGTAGQVLTVNSGATAPEWATLPAAGGQTLISTATLSAATAISFTSIPTTYKHLRLIFTNTYSTSGSWNMTFNNVTTGGHYQTQCTAGTTSIGNSTNNEAGGAFNNDRCGIIPATFNGSGNGTANGYCEIYNYASTTVNRTGHYSVTGYDGSYFCNVGAFNYANNGAAITRIDFVRTSTQSITGKIELWGIA